MANQKLSSGAAASVFMMSLAQPPSGTAAPANNNSYNLWLNGVKVIPDTSLSTLPVAVNGFTVSAETYVNGYQISSLTLQISSSTALAPGTYVLNTNNGPYASTANIDINVPSATPQNFALAFFSPSAGGPPSLSASWQQPAQGQPDSYNIKLGGASGAETLALNVPGNVLSHTFPAYGYGSVFGIVTAIYGGTEGSPSGEAGANAPVPPPTLTATGELAGGVPAILLSVH